MSKATTTSAKKGTPRDANEFKQFKATRMQRLYGVEEPAVINERLLTAACLAQGPGGEAGRLVRSDGVNFAKIKELSLAFQNILHIGGLDFFISLTVLKLDNNVIEKIENLDQLVNLTWLDLSFNKISKIENMDFLTKLEDLSLYFNKISRIENMDKLKNLKFLSIGKNELADQDNLLYLRQFKKLECLNIEGNQICQEEGYEDFIFAFLQRLSYLDYKAILPEWRTKAYEKYQIAVDQMNERQKETEATIEEAEETKLHLNECKAAFVDLMEGNILFDLIFDDDTEGQKLIRLSSVHELLDQYREKVCDSCKQFYTVGQEEYQKRKTEEEMMRECIHLAKDQARTKSFELIKQYQLKKEMLLKQMDELGQDSFPAAYEMSLSDLRQAIYELWHSLMDIESNLVNQLEDLITDFGRNITEMAAMFLEQVQVCFSRCREAATGFNERFTELTLTYAERAAKSDQQDPEAAIYMDREGLLNSLNNSKDFQLAKLDKYEDSIVKNVHNRFENLNKELRQTEEYDRHSKRITEIGMYIDSQYIELDMASLDQI